MPKAKKRGRGAKGDKEKPLLTLQGILKLDKSFVTEQHEGAETVKVQVPGTENPVEIKLVPGQSEHDLVAYKAGYAVGPSNPLPQNEPEKELFEQQKKVDAVNQGFENLKKQSEEERKQREEQFKRAGLLPDHPPGDPSNEATTPFDPDAANPDNPKNYYLPDNLSSEPAFHNDTPLEFGVKTVPLPVMKMETEDKSTNGDRKGDSSIENIGNNSCESNPNEKESQSLQSNGEEYEHSSLNQFGSNEEVPVTDAHLLPSMKPLPDEAQFGKDMVLDVALKMEEVRRQKRMERKKRVKEAEEAGLAPDPDDLEKDWESQDDDMIYSLDEIQELKKKEEEQNRNQAQGPEISETHMQQVMQEKDDYDAKAVLESYWTFVRENPQDFNGWTYLLQHVETIDIIEEVRVAYNKFLPVYPYCYAYWIRYMEIEKKHENWQRALAILHRGLQAIPLSSDLWISYLELYYQIYEQHEGFDNLFYQQCETAVQTVGLDYKSDILWEKYIEWELARKNLKRVTDIYLRLASVPTKLYNKHWDNFIAFVRDHHPRDILNYDDYEELRKLTCRELGLTYRPDPVTGETSQPREVALPEDKLKAGMKERIVASVVGAHESCEEAVDKRYRFEEKIKRSYFHVKPLDLKQLKNWDSYLDFEIGEGDHDRIVVLFERCLIPCAQYEQFWAKYARYLEQHFKKEFETAKIKTKSEEKSKSIVAVNGSPLKKAKWAFGTGLNKVDEIRDKRTSWSMKGWKETDKDGKEIMVGEPILEIHESNKSNNESDATDIPSVDRDDSTLNRNIVYSKEDLHPTQTSTMEDDSSDHAVINTAFEKEIESEMTDVLKTSWTHSGVDSIRDVYNRACVVHCPKRALIKLKWAAFEEEYGDIEKAKDILVLLKQKYPLLLECSMQLIDIERRQNNLDKCKEQYKKLLKIIPQNRQNIKTWVSLKIARFQFKVCGDSDEALKTLRVAMRKERGDPRLYAQIIDVCYQRQPVDVAGVTASIELALVAEKLTNMQKLEFVKRKVEFMQEFGDIRRYRDACEQLKKYRRLCAVELKVESKKKKELEVEEKKLKELEELKAQTRAQANMKAKIAESEGKLLCGNCQASMYPNAQGVYEFEGFVPGVTNINQGTPTASTVKKDKVTNGTDDDGIVDLLDMEIPEEEEMQIKKSLEEKTKYKEVAPTWELNIETYGYGKKRKTYDPDYEHVESAKFREFERLEGQGYDEDKLDPDRDKLKNIKAPGLAAKDEETTTTDPKEKYTTSDYIVPPKVPQIEMGPGIGPVRPSGSTSNPKEENTVVTEVFELPPEIANPQKSPCVNVPEWFVKDGGELCLSDTQNGMSVIRYWPKFLSSKGNALMFNRLRKYCKWHQKQVKIGGDWKYETRLIAWYGPCDYNYSGLHLDKNLNWAPELLDLLHRLIAMTRHEFNSCFCNLYRHGHDMCGWHADVHPQLGRNPPVASVSLGAVRVFEFRKKNGPPNFIRFPLFPGSLLVMEGATQEDWLHCLPRDTNCKEERINLTFRTMYSIDKRSNRF